ncbi:hemolysin D [Pseudoalteromonas luteoviolacea]|uniref:Hemolysin D n=1 Tax=Pseudoalteromonas luteoviolacea TaxID=43657 RepID=A0A0C1MG03_9GAMM|nr:efflux RND transporter periplasmic adaptor subunit [Pseudoalteromonas luteoviolacea]KID55769.1 hemolysin D [Pseudoalteromonas luteoviolacea]
MFKRVLVLSSALLLGACQDEVIQSPNQDLVRPVKLHTVSDPAAAAIRHFPAEVVANQGSYLAFRVNGELIDFPILAGQEVKKGQLLAKLDPEDFELQFQQRKAQYELATLQLNRIESLFNKSTASKAEYDQALANKQVTESAYRIAQTNLQNSELRAPFDGTVAKVFVKNFENIVAKQNILRLETRDRMDVVIQVPEKLVARVNKDLDYHPTVIFDGFPDKSYSLTIKEWDTQADPVTLTYKVVFSLPIPEDFNLFAGMTGHVYIDPSKVMNLQKSALLVPNEAVFSAQDEQIDNNHYVWVFNTNTNTVNKRRITLGEMRASSIEVLDGLKAGEVVVAAGVHHLKENLKVRPWTKERGL